MVETGSRSQLLHVGEVVAANAALYPDRPAARDLGRSLTFAQYDDRACRLGNALLGLGLRKGDRVAILAYNCLEWMEIYAAVAKAGLVAVPVNFRLAAPEIRYILEDSGARAFVVAGDFIEIVDGVRADLPIAAERYVHIGPGPTPVGYAGYEDLIARASAAEPGIPVHPDDAWTIMYTSGTTGSPKGAVRSHRSYALFYLLNAIEFGFGRGDTGLAVMPMFHVNSIFYAFVFTYVGAGVCVYDRRSFDPEHLLATFAAERVTYTSLVPTHYVMMLGLPEATKRRYDVDCVRQLLVSSAPAREETKLAIMAFFRNSRLFEAYGSTEAGLVTLLRPEDQLRKLGSIGREIVGTGRLRLLDDDGREVADGEVGELYSHTPTAFDGYWGKPALTERAFRGPYCTAGDMARRDADGFYTLVDRKSNLIISGGENVYPSEVEQALAAHPDVVDVAVVGVPHEKWGEAVHAVVVAREGRAVSADELVAFCRSRIAGYKLPKSVAFLAADEMPRTATGKILHRVLRERLGRTP